MANQTYIDYKDKAGNVTILSLTGSLLGSASFATSASWAPAGTTLVTGSTYPITASWAVSASIASTASFVTASNVIGILTAAQAPSASVSVSSSYALSASFSTSASWAPGGGGASLGTGSTYPFTASWAVTASAFAAYSGSSQLYLQCDDNNTYQVTLTKYSGSITFAIGQTPVSGINGFLNIGSVGALVTGSTYPITSSYAITASFALNGGGGGGASLGTGSTYPFTSSWALTASYFSASAPGLLYLTADDGNTYGVTLRNDGGVITLAVSQSAAIGNLPGVLMLSTNSASYALSASYSLSSSVSLTASYVYPTGSSLLLTASNSQIQFSYATLTTSSVGTPGVTCSFSDAKEFVTFNTASVTYTFTSSNTPSAGVYAATSIYINNTFTGNTASLSFPAGWNFVGLKPTYITASKPVKLELESYGSTVVAAWIPAY